MTICARFRCLGMAFFLLAAALAPAAPAWAQDPSDAEVDDDTFLSLGGAISLGTGSAFIVGGGMVAGVGLVQLDSGFDDVDIRIVYAVLGTGLAVMAVGLLLVLTGGTMMIIDAFVE